ncbi:MAG: PAS domain S-box protein [Proteobacteria bacterium]|nr:PAS domain S-box protein [Pseudomonadota bacterium]
MLKDKFISVGKERRDIIIVIAITLLLPLFSMYIHFSERLYDFSSEYELLGITEYLINFSFLYLSGLLYLTYRRWLKAEKKRKELENIISSINPDVLLVVDQRRHIIVCNNTVQRMFGYDVNEVIQQATDLLYFDRRSYPEDNKHEIYETLEREGFHVGLATGKTKNNETFPLEIITGNLSGEYGAVLLLRDITARKKAEDALLKAHNELEMRVRERTEELTLQSIALSDEIVMRKQKEEELQMERIKFQILTENAPFGMALIEADGTFRYANAGFLALYGYDSDECHSWVSWLERITPDNLTWHDSGFDWDDIQQELSLSVKITRMMKITRKDGAEKTVSCSIVPLEAGKYLMSCEDITDRKIAEDSLSESEERYRTVIENSNDGIAIVRDEIFTFVNRKFSEMFGYESPQEIEGKPALSVVHPDDATNVNQALLLRQLDEKIVARYEFRGLKKNLEQIFLEASETNITFFGLPVSLLYVHDITERKSLESQLLHAQKMEAIGTLAGGVAHDFNNILTALMGYATLMQIKMDKDNSLRTYVDQILSASRKAADLTQSLLTFSRKQPVTLVPLDINNTIKVTEKLLKKLITEDIELRTFLTQDDMIVMADKSQMDQILFNLVANARDAMPKGGRSP